MVNALRNDYRTASISEQDRTMLDYVVKLTKDATKCGREDHVKPKTSGVRDVARKHCAQDRCAHPGDGVTERGR